jgi:hypothetical protein
LREDERSGRVRPQGFLPVQYFRDKGEWVGRVTGLAGQPSKIFAVVAPPSSCDFFQYYQKLGAQLPQYEPRNRIPPSVQIELSVQARLPPQRDV